MIYYSIECNRGNGGNKPYPSDHIFIMDENLNELINRFILANKHFDFTKWKKCVFIKWDYDGDRVHMPGDPKKIKFENGRIEIEGIGIYET